MKTVQWMITGRCNLNCRHCYLQGCPDSGVEPSLDALVRTMDRLYAEGIRDVVLTGGEPLARGDIEAVFRQLTARGLRVSRVITNGCLLTDDLLALLESLGQAPVFNISYDGDGGAHDALRRKAGMGEAALEAFDLCRRRGFQTASDVTVHRENADALPDTLNTLARHGCGLVKVMPLFPLGNGAHDTDHLLLTGEAFLDLVCQTIPRYYVDGLPFELYMSSCFYARGADGGWAIPMLVLKQCADPLGVALCRRDIEASFLSASGRLMPCPGMAALGAEAGAFAEFEAAGLSGAMRYGGYERLMRYTVADHMRQNAECRACGHALACGGGCRAAAMAFEGRFTGKDPFTCAFFKNDGEARIREAVARGTLLRALGANAEGSK